MKRYSAALSLAWMLMPAVAQAAPRYEATITRTSFGVPHIKAKTFGGLGFGAAYAEAQDNICLMADSYLSVSAERSKFLGPDGMTLLGLGMARNIDNDVFFQAVTDMPVLRAAFARRSTDFRALVDGWVAGYNRFLKAQAGRLPKECAGQPWVRAITRDDVLRSLNSFSMLSSSATLSAQIANAAPPAATVGAIERTLPTALAVRSMALPDSATLGSNGWAFGGDATTNGRGLVLGNPHFPWFGPNRFYQMHLTIPGKFDVAGAAIINQPYVGIGFNKDIAWTHTVDTAAHMTLFKLALDPADPTAYLVDGKREAMTRRQVTIAVKDGAPVVRTLYGTRYGPVAAMPGTPYAWTRAGVYAVADANNGNIRTGEGWMDIARARNVRGVHDALARHLGAHFINTMAADRDGEALYADIAAAPNVSAAGFTACGTVSDLVPGQLQRFYTLDGSRSACAWEKAKGTPVPGLLPASEMAAQFRRDFVQNSNDSYRWSNPAAGIKELGPMMGKDRGATPDPRTRSGLQEIGRVLQSRKFDIELAAQTMFGNKNFIAQYTLPEMRKLCERPSAPRPACAALAKWDGKAELDSRGVSLFTAFWAKAGARPGIWAVPFDPADPVNTPRALIVDGAKGDALLADLAAAADALGQLGIPLDARLGDVQFAERGAERIPISGAPIGGVLNYTASRPVKGGFAVVHGASYVQSVTFDDKGPIANAVLTYSQSTDPASPHYADQTREFSQKKLHRYPFSDAEIAADTIAPPLTIRQ
jgi:acyl-homoserine-lactone acylase